MVIVSAEGEQTTIAVNVNNIIKSILSMPRPAHCSASIRLGWFNAFGRTVSPGRRNSCVWRFWGPS